MRHRHSSPLCLVLILIAPLLGLTGCLRNGPDACDDSSGQDWGLPDFERDQQGGPGSETTLLGVGEPCWFDHCSGTPKDYEVFEHYPLQKYNFDRRACRPEHYCHIEQGCQPRIPRGESCAHVPEEIFRGVCAEFDDVCYPSEPDDPNDQTPGPRICRPLPAKEGEWCDHDYLAICRSDEIDRSWRVDQEFRYDGSLAYTIPHDFDVVPELDRIMDISLNSGYPDRRDLQLFQRPEDFPPGAEYERDTDPKLLRPLQLYCKDYRCTQAPGPGEPCAELSAARMFPEYGHLNLACAQPPEMAVSRPIPRLGNQYEVDFTRAVLCIEGTCQAMEDLDPDGCYKLAGAESDEDPSFCGAVANSDCGGNRDSCLSVCRKDGTCGICNTCDYGDGRVEQVESRADCPDEGDYWREDAGDWNPSWDNGGQECGAELKVTFSGLKPSPGNLSLTLGLGGNMTPDSRYFTLLINGEQENIVVVNGEETGFVWDSPGVCSDARYSLGEPTFNEADTSSLVNCACPLQITNEVTLLLADRWKNSTELEVVLKANEDWCLECDARMALKLEHSREVYREQIRDDQVCR